ncbi:MAG: signal recognition particle-docking protein FtsY [Candidatus Marinimicrobia bacterium]|nr:signal recognition particle-docking protein FtsY [Candidatus Neomarinimicrobiota bacterium]
MSNVIKEKYEEIPAYKVVTASNIISLIRALLAIPIIYFLNKDMGGIAFIFIVICAISDLLDGWLARISNQITALGKVIDPIADKIVMNSVLLFLVLAENGNLIYYFLLILIRDFSISMLGMYVINTRKVSIHANRLGKISIFITGFAILTFLYPTYVNDSIRQILLYGSIISLALSWIKYIYDFTKIIAHSETPAAAKEKEEQQEEQKIKGLKSGLDKTEKSIASRLPLIKKFFTVDQDILEDVEETLIATDMGVELTDHLVEKLSNVKKENAAQLRSILKSEIKSLLKHDQHSKTEITNKPHVILFVGVNGTGKTTTIGKLAHKYSSESKDVLIAAADTYRAAAYEQLKIWSERSHVDFMGNPEGKDPAAVAYDAVKSAEARNKDVLLIDTAGRLHTKSNLMQELQKIERVCGKALEGAPHDVWLVLDGTTGQNGIRQAEKFSEAVNVSGLIVTKLDGTAKGGAVLAIHNKMELPIKYLGIGEQLPDIVEFDPDEYVEALLT